MAEAYPYVPVEPPAALPVDGGMAGIVNPTPQVPSELQQAMRPPVDEAEYQQRVGLWQQLQDKLKADPNLQSALLRFGTAMMQPRPYGQTGAGHIGNAINAGANYYQAGVQTQAEEARKTEEQRLKQEELGVRKQEAQSRIGLQTAQTGQVQAQTTAITRELEPRIKHIEAQTRGIGADVDYKGALTALSKLEYELKNKYGEKEAIAKLEQMGADKLRTEALAGYYNAHSEQVRQATEQGKGWQPTGRKVDEDRGIIFDESLNKTTGEKQRVTTYLPVPYSTAVGRAKIEVDAVLKQTSNSWFGTSRDQIDALSRYIGQPVKDEKEAIKVLAQRMSEGHTIIQNITTSGGVTTRRVDGDKTSTQGAAPTNEAARQAAEAAMRRGENVTVSGPTPNVVPSVVSPNVLQSKGWRPGLTGTIQIDGKDYRVDAQGNATPVQPIATSSVIASVGSTSAPTSVTPPATPAPAAAPVSLPPEAESMIKPLLGGAYEIKVPAARRGSAGPTWARPLDGTTYRSREEALQALRNLYR